MSDPQERTSGPDDTAAFQRFYSAGSPERSQKSLIYRLLVGWWRDRS